MSISKSNVGALIVIVFFGVVIDLFIGWENILWGGLSLLLIGALIYYLGNKK